MSWCGGGEIRPTPGVEWRSRRDQVVDLVARQLAALAGLRALRDLDLQLVGVDEVARRDAEAARGDLLDRRAAQVAVRVGRRARGSSPPSPVFERPPMRFIAIASVSCASLRDRAERHRAGREARTISLDGSTSVERDRAAGRHELEQAAQRRRLRRRLVDRLGERAERRVALVAHGALQRRDRVGVPDVVLARRRGTGRAPPRVEPPSAASSAARVARARRRRDAVEPDAADARGGAGEVAVDDRGGRARRPRRSARRGSSGSSRCPSSRAPSAGPCRSP